MGKVIDAVQNPGTGQNWRHAVRQYKVDRDPRSPLFASQTGIRLSRKFPGTPIQKRFGYERLTELLSTLEGITLRGEGERTTVNLKATGPRP